MFLLSPEEKHPDGHAIGGKTDHKDDNVNDWEKDSGNVALECGGCLMVHNNLVRIFWVYNPNESPSLRDTWK